MTVPKFGLRILFDDHCISFLDLWRLLLIFRLIFIFRCRALQYLHLMQSIHQSSFSVFGFPPHVYFRRIFTFQCGPYFLFHDSPSTTQSNFSFFEFLPDVWLSFLRWAFPPILGHHPQSFRPYFILPMLPWRTGPRHLKLPMIGSVRFSCPSHWNLG